MELLKQQFTQVYIYDFNLVKRKLTVKPFSQFDLEELSNILVSNKLPDFISGNKNEDKTQDLVTEFMLDIENKGSKQRLIVISKILWLILTSECKKAIVECKVEGEDYDPQTGNVISITSPIDKLVALLGLATQVVINLEGLNEEQQDQRITNHIYAATYNLSSVMNAIFTALGASFPKDEETKKKEQMAALEKLIFAGTQ